MSENKKVSIKDMAKACGVSVATISRAFKEGTEINQKTRQAIVEKAALLGYSPNPSAQSLRLQRSSNIGLLIPEISNRLYLGLIEKLDHALQTHNLRLLVRFTKTNDPDSEREALLSMYRAHVESVIFIPQKGSFSKDILNTYGEALRPIQVFRSVYPNFDSVRIDDEQGIRNAMDHLIENGHQRILFLGTKSRMPAYCDALSKHGLPYDEQLAVADTNYLDITAIYNLIKTQKPTAILAVASAAEQTLWTLLRHNISFPQEISFLAYDDVNWVSSFDITAIAHPLNEMVDQIVRLLLKRLSNEHSNDAPEQILLYPELIFRSSVQHI